MKTSILLTMHGNFHRKSNTKEFIPARKKRGWTWASIIVTFLNETRSIPWKRRPSIGC